MFVLDYQTQETATEGVADIYGHFVTKRSPVPAPLQLLSTSPDLLNLTFDQIKYFMRHPALSFPVLAAIRFLAAREVCFDQCTTLNKTWLGKVGLSVGDMEDLAEGRKVEAFNEAENALLSAVGRVLRREKISGVEVQKLRDLGWKDSDILDACAQGTNLISSSYLFAAFSK